MILEFSGQIFEKYSNVMFNEYTSSGSRVLYGRTDGQTDMTKLIVALPNVEIALVTFVQPPLGTRFDVLTLGFLKIQII
jgi:hypothetical protein